MVLEFRVMIQNNENYLSAREIAALLELGQITEETQVFSNEERKWLNYGNYHQLIELVQLTKPNLIQPSTKYTNAVVLNEQKKICSTCLEVNDSDLSVCKRCQFKFEEQCPDSSTKPSVIIEKEGESGNFVTCKSCNHKCSQRAIKCPKCGVEFLKICTICSAEIRANSELCPECGDPKPFELSAEIRQPLNPSEVGVCSINESITSLSNSTASHEYVDKLINKPLENTKSLETQSATQKPQPVDTAVNLVWASLAAGLLKTMIDYSHLTSLTSAAFTNFVLVFTFALVGFLIFKISAGKNWARITFLVLFIVGVLPFLFIVLDEFSRSSTVGALSVTQISLQVYALFLLFTQPGSIWFSPSQSSVCSINHSNKSCGNSTTMLEYVNKFINKTLANGTSLGDVHHPWRRLFARFIDTFGWSVVLYYIVFTVFENPFISSFMAIPLSILLEATLLSVTGNTLGKWVFGITLKTTSGEKLLFNQGLSRSFRAVFQGAGMGIPVIGFFTQIFAYRRLYRTGTTLWDAATETVVSHKEWGVTRAILCTLSVLLVLILTSVSKHVSSELLMTYVDTSSVISNPANSVKFDSSKPYTIVSSPDRTESKEVVTESKFAEFFNDFDATVLVEKNDWHGLLEHSLNWTKSKPGSYSAWNYLGEAYRHSGQTTEAINSYRQATQINPQFIAAWYNLGVAYRDSGQTKQVIGVYQQLKALDIAEASLFFDLVISTSPKLRNIKR
jgi:hypothetical protein